MRDADQGRWDKPASLAPRPAAVPNSDALRMPRCQPRPVFCPFASHAALAEQQPRSHTRSKPPPSQVPASFTGDASSAALH